MAQAIKTTASFDRRYKKLPRKIKDKAKEKENIFRNNPFDHRLRTHKLHGKEKEMWAFWIDYKYRIKFVFLGEGEVLLLDVGTHDMYK
tara:strand:- start:256 stop:519 length:264 start_codon:yes stop_codon:yes gene_type:complete